MAACRWRAAALGVLIAWACGGEGEPKAGALMRGADEEIPSATLLRSRADLAFRAAEFDTARVLYHRALSAARIEGDSAAVAVILTALGNTARRLGEYDSARGWGEAALALKLRLGFRDLLFDSYNALGLLAWEQDRLPVARQRFSEAMQASEGAHDTVRAKVANNLAQVLQDVGEFPTARRKFQEAIRAARLHGNSYIEGRALNNLAVLENQVGRPQIAFELLTRAGPLVKADPVLELNWLGQMGAVAAAMGEPGRGIVWLDSALRQSRARSNRWEEASNLEQLADLHWMAGDPRRALDLLSRAESLNRELDRPVYLGIDLRRGSEIDAELGDLPSAFAKIRHALQVHRQAGAGFEELSDLLLLAELSARTGAWDEGRRHLAAAQRVADNLEAPTAQVAYHLAAAQLTASRGQHREGLRLLESAARNLALASDEIRWQAELIRSRALAGLGNLPGAVEAGYRALASVERIRGRFGSQVLRSAYQARREEVYSHLVDLLLDLGRIEEAFAIADAGRGRALLEHVAASASESAAQGEMGGGSSVRELAEEERKLLGRIDSMDLALRSLADGGGNRGELAGERERLLQELARTRSAYELALIHADERFAGRRSLLGGRGETGSVRRALAADEALLEYLVTSARVVIFVVRRDTTAVHRVAVDRATLRAKVRIARETNARPVAAGGGAPSIPGEAALADLFDLLVAPMLSKNGFEGVRRLVIVPHGELQYLPFAALRNPRTGRFLIEDFTLIHLPASGVLAALRSRPAPGSFRGTYSAFAPFPDALPGTRREVSAIARTGVTLRVRRGARATEAGLRDAFQRDRVVHVATHGVLSVHNPLFSRVELSRGRGGRANRSDDDGRLEVHEVLDLRVVSRLVFLSGCETGSGPAWSTAFDPGEDYATLARAFLFAGVDNVVATLWRIEDEGAAAFAAEFYRALVRGDPVEALAEAQRAMLGGGRYGAPFYWAGYRLDGRG